MSVSKDLVKQEMRVEEIFKPNECEPSEKESPECLRITDKVCETFNNKKSLGISEVCKLDNCRIDGLLQLDNGKVIALEIKYALNWQTTCNARIEIQRFFQEEMIQRYFKEKPSPTVPKKQPAQALIVFSRFSGDWQRRNGWQLFYWEEKILRGKFPIVPIDIAQFDDRQLILGPEK